MIIVGSANAQVGMAAGWAVLARGRSALEAVVRLVEDNPADHTVGFAGYPNILGQVELDASIMDGNGRRAGAVGALRGYREAISVARETGRRGRADRPAFRPGSHLCSGSLPSKGIKRAKENEPL